MSSNEYKNLSISHWNCQSINNKKALFNKFLNDINPDIICLNETKLNHTKNIEFKTITLLEKIGIAMVVE